jgi:hypothetical protein
VSVLDWRDSTHWNGRRRVPCVHCGKPALLVDDKMRPSHKKCVEAALAALPEEPSR